MKCGFLNFSLGIGFMLVAQLASSQPQAVDGVLDLRHYDLVSGEPIKLKGDWRFYWQEFIKPNTSLQQRKTNYHIVKAPANWATYSLDGASLPAAGYASYSMTILLPESPPNLALRVGPFFMAGKLFVNGREVYRSGQPARSKELSQHSMKPGIIDLPASGQNLELVAHVSNYRHHLAGIAEIQVGERQTIHRQSRTFIGLTLFIIGAIFIMAIYHICLHLLRRKDKSTLAFAGLCLGNSLFIFVVSGAIYDFFPNIHVETWWNLFYSGWYLGQAFFTFFTYYLYPQEYSKRFAQVATMISVMSLLVVYATPFEIASQTALVNQIAAFVVFVYTCYTIYKAKRAIRDGAMIFVTATTIFFLAIVNDILVAENLIEGEYLSAVGLYFFIFFQSFLLSQRFSKAFNHLEVAEKEIRELNEGLERKVEEKTRDIRSILHTIPQGIFTVSLNNETIRVNEEYSLYLEQILETRDIGRRRFDDLVLEHTDLSNDRKSQMISSVWASLGEDEVGFIANEANFAREFTLQQNGQKKIIELDWSPMFDQDNQVEKILVSMRDVTSLRALQEESVRQQKELEYISEIVNVSADQFDQFIRMSQGLMEENRRLIEANAIKNTEVLKILFINLHTIKGTARSYYFHKMTGILHDVEQGYAELLRNEDCPWDRDRLLADLQRAKDIIDLYDEINASKLGRKKDVNVIAIDRHMVEEKVNSLNLIDTSRMGDLEKDIIESTRAAFNEVFYNRSIDIFQDILSSSERLARDLGKENPIIEINDPGYALSSDAQELMRNIFTHIVRNSLDHGIETSAQRVAKGKKPTGTIQLTLQDNPDGSLEIVYRDDGQGLNLKDLRELGIKRQLLNPQRDYSDIQIAELIFESGLSTSSKLTEISGRGVGMDAVRKYLEKEGGRINIELYEAKFEGFRNFAFRITVPNRFYTRAA
jgi:PAS domain-containing protein